MSGDTASVATPASRSRRAWYAAGAAVLVLAVALIGWRMAAAPRFEFTEYAMLQAHDIPIALAFAPDGSAWFTIDLSNAIGRIRNGQLERFTKPATNLEPVGIAVAPDGSVWFTDAEARAISRRTPAGKFESIDLETPIARLGQLAVAPDGAVWFAEGSAYSITRMKDGALKRHVIQSVRGGPFGVTVAPDGTVWATLQGANQLLRIAPDGTMRAFDIPTRGSVPSDVTVAPDGAVWLLQFRANKIARFRDGRFEEFLVEGANAGLTGLAVAPDGSVWFGMLRRNVLGRLEDGKIEHIRLPRNNARPYSVAIDRSGSIWYTDISGYVGRIDASRSLRSGP
jgi:virginiamycin B lyase